MRDFIWHKYVKKHSEPFTTPRENNFDRNLILSIQNVFKQVKKRTEILLKRFILPFLLPSCTNFDNTTQFFKRYTFDLFSAFSPFKKYYFSHSVEKNLNEKWSALNNVSNK